MCFLDDFRRDRLAPSGITFQQRAETELVDDSGNALASFSDKCQGLWLEQRIAAMAGHFQAVTDISGSFLRRECFQNLHHGDALQQLRQLWLSEFLPELRLTGQNDLQQFGIGSLEVRKQTDGFEDRIVEVLRFIDDQDKSPACQHFSEQHFVQLVMHSHEPHAIRIDP